MVTAPAHTVVKPRVVHTPKVENQAAAPLPSSGSGDFTEHVGTCDVKLQVRRDDSMHVTEAIEYDFGDGPFPSSRRAGITASPLLRSGSPTRAGTWFEDRGPGHDRQRGQDLRRRQ